MSFLLQANAELALIWAVGQCMWQRDFPSIYEALDKQWSEPLKPIMSALHGKWGKYKTRGLYYYWDPMLSQASLIARFMGPTWGRQGPGGPHVGPMNLAIWALNYFQHSFHMKAVPGPPTPKAYTTLVPIFMKGYFFKVRHVFVKSRKTGKFCMYLPVFIWFLPEARFGLRVLSLHVSVCVSVRPSVRVCGNHLLVCAITHYPFKLGSPNLHHRCKRPWLRYLLFWGVIDLDLQGQIWLQSQKLPHFELVGKIAHHLFKLGSPNLG